MTTGLALSCVTGSDSGVGVEGWGFDVGATFEPEALEPLSFTLAYAFGSGSIQEGRDGSFHQTGLQDNNGKFAESLLFATTAS